MNSASSKLSRFVLALTALAAIVGSTTTCGASVAYRITVDGNVLASGSTAGSTLNVTGNFGVFGITGLQISTTANSLSTTGGQIVVEDIGTLHTLYIETSADAFTSPAGPNYLLGSSSGYTSGISFAGDTYEFQSFATQGNSALAFPTSNPSPGGILDIGAGAGDFDEADTAFSSTLPYTLTQHLTLTINSGFTFATNLTGSTVVKEGSLNPVPEPSTLIGACASAMAGLVFAARRRRRVS